MRRNGSADARSSFWFTKISKICYLSGFLETGAGLAVVFNQEQWDKLPKDLQAICESAALAVNTETCAQFDYMNAQALAKLKADGVEFYNTLTRLLKHNAMLGTRSKLD